MEFTTSQKNILNRINQNRKISRKKIAEELGLTPAAITKILNTLIEKGVVIETEHSKSTGGRKAINLEINGEWIGEILGISITPKEILVSVSDVKNIVEPQKYIIKKEQSCSEILDEIIQKVLEKNKRIQKISIVTTGFIDFEKGKIIFSPHYNWRDVNLKQELEEKFKIPVLIENDVRAMALAEKYYGMCSETKEFVILNVTDGIGSAIIIDHELYSGHRYMSGEIGHVVVDRSSLRRCSCGKKGCLEALASNKAIIKYLESLIYLNNHSSLKKILKEKGHLEIEDILKGVNEKDYLSIKVTTEAMEILAHSIDMIISLINPERIILVGEIFQNEYLMNIIKKELNKVVLSEQEYKLEVASLIKNIDMYSPFAVAIHNLFR